MTGHVAYFSFLFRLNDYLELLFNLTCDKICIPSIYILMFLWLPYGGLIFLLDSFSLALKGVDS